VFGVVRRLLVIAVAAIAVACSQQSDSTTEPSDGGTQGGGGGAGAGGTGGSGGTGSGGGSGGGAGGGPITVAQRATTLKAAEEKAADLRRQRLTGDAFNQALATWLTQRPEIEAAGVDETSTVWGRFKDGRLLLIPNNRTPQPASASLAPATEAANIAQVAAEATELPDAKQVRLFHAFGPAFGGQSVITLMTPWFRDAGYTIAAGAEGDARVETLRHVSGDGFFYFNTHGGKGKARDGHDMFAIWTSSTADSIKDKFADFKDDLDTQRLVYMLERNGVTNPDGSEVYETRYAITYLFVEKYMSFGKNSILYFNVCYGGNENSDIQSFIFAAHKKGAAVYLGWTKVLTESAAFTSLPYFVDRLLGANQFRAENPKQRPFAWPDVMEDMAKKGLDVIPASSAKLIAYPATQTGAIAGLLAPSIQYVLADQHTDRLLLTGIFGADPGADGKVTINDGSGEVAVKVVSWSPTSITVELPRSGAGSSGDVLVYVRGHPSNPRRLVAWRGTLTYMLRDMGTLTIRAVMSVDFRLDPGMIRLKPGDPPQSFPVAPVSSNPRMTTDLSVTGTYVQNNGSCTNTHTWAGSAQLAWYSGVPVVGYAAFASVDLTTRTLLFRPQIASTYNATRVTTCNGSTTETTARDLAIASQLFDKPGAVTLTLDGQLNIVAGSRSALVPSSFGGNATATLTWSLIRATPPYDATQPR
jgi:hypothetical protein